MKRTLKLLAICALLAAPASAQFIGYVSPQGVVAKPFNGAIAAGTSPLIKNLGQTIHFLSYTIAGGSTGVDIRLEGSYDNSTFFAISDEGTDTTQGLVVAVGYYPFVRANLVACGGCGGGLTANYSGVSSLAGTPYGFYNPSQQTRKVLATGLSSGSNQSASGIVAPYGSGAGFLVMVGSGVFPGGSSVTATGVLAGASFTVGSFNLDTTHGFQVFPMASGPPLSTITFNYTSGGASANTFSAYYVFLPPGAAQPYGAQPSNTSNTEATAVNATVTTTLTAGSGKRAHLFSLNARCSAGTAVVTVKDGTTTIWSSGGAEVTTSSFTRSWNPGLASSPQNDLVISLTTCGAANTGTLDVQGSVF